MTQEYETQLRVALDAKAHEVDPPVGLADRTLDAVRELERESLRDRWRARRDARIPVAGYPRWMQAAGAAAAVALLFGVGAFVTRTPGRSDHKAASLTAGGDVDVTRGSSDSSGSFAGSAVTGPAPKASLPPKIAKTANVTIAVRDFEGSWRNANDVAERNGGFVTNSSTEQDKTGFASGTLTMRVPTDKLDDTIKDLRTLGTLANLSTKGTDVSAPIADLAARRKTAEGEEARLLELLNSAPSAGDVAEIRGRLDGVRTEIESLKAQEASYRDRVDYATVIATLTRNTTPGRPVVGDGTIGKAIRTAVRLAMTLVAGAIVTVPLILVALLAWFVVRIYRRRAA
jgi:hypothetical protein